LRFALLALAAGSGAAALIYEVVWFQLLELVIGTSAISLGLLLATFMAGMFLGSLLLPRIPARRNPLVVYAVMELAIAVLGLVVLIALPLAGGLYTAWAGDGVRGLALRGILAALFLLPPTIVMGGALPILTRRVRREADSAARLGSIGWLGWTGWLYAANIGGGVFGSLLAGFYLLRVFDLAIATYAGVAINVAIAVGAVVLARVQPERSDEAVSVGAASREREGNDFSLYLAIALSGFCALAAETVWVRALGLLFGASAYTLSLVIAVYLAGLGIGSGLAALLVRSIASARSALAWSQILAAGAIAWTAYTVNASFPNWPVNPTLSDIWFNFQIDIHRAFWALLPPTLLWGAAFPLALSASRTGKDNAKLVGNLYAANTIGAVLGALAASFVLIPLVGSQRAQQLLIGLSVVAGFLVFFSSERRSSVGTAFWRVASAGAILVLGIYTVPPLSGLLVAHGRFAVTWAGKSDIVYAAEGWSSSVAVSSFPNDLLTFHVAGKIQASNVPRDLRLQRMLGHLTTLTAASPRSVLVIGCGAGVTAGAVAIDPRVERVTLVEIEPLVPEAAGKYFGDVNFNVVQNPKVQIRVDDGRHFLMTSKERFDAITADPLDPWVKGAANLYTREFLQSARQHLNPGGTITVYVQLFETNLDAVKSLVGTFFEVFPNASVWGNTYQGRGHDMVLLGQTEEQPINLDELQTRLEQPDYKPVGDSLSEIGMASVVDLFSTYAGRPADLTDWLKDASINTDRNLRMQYLAGLGLNLDEGAAIYADMLQHRRFPEVLFAGGESVARLRSAIGQ
jgi:spermidine synthase